MDALTRPERFLSRTFDTELFAISATSTAGGLICHILIPVYSVYHGTQDGAPLTAKLSAYGF